MCKVYYAPFNNNNSITIGAGTGLSGGGVVALGNSTTLANTGVIAVNGNSDITASTDNGLVTLGSTAASDNIPNSLVKRDAHGDFSAGTTTANILSANIIQLPMNGYITANNALLMFSGQNNFFAGYMAGNTNFFSVGSGNTGVGQQALQKIGNGSYNTAVGYQVLMNDNAGSGNVGVGSQSLAFCTNGYNNTAVGGGALSGITSGYNNIALGITAAYALSGNASNNIEIGHVGVSGDNNTIRIGDSFTHKATYIAGIYGVTSSGGTPVYVNGNGQLGTVTSSEKYKQDIHDMDDSSDVISSLRPVTFRYKPEIDPVGIPQFGLVAEEVDKIDPDLVVRDGQHGIYTVRYDAINAMLLNEFLKEHHTVQKQSVEIQELKIQNDMLEKRLEQVEHFIEATKTAPRN